MHIFKRIIIYSMLADFLVLAFTGIVKVPETQRYFSFAYDYFSASALSYIHDRSGVLLVILIIIHLVLKKDWFLKQLRNLRVPDNINRALTPVLLIVLVIVGLYYLENKLGGKETITLSGVEVQEYKGEKLGSIQDFRENSIKGPQHVDRATYHLDVTGLVDKPVSLAYDEILKLQPYQKVVTLNCVEGWSVKGLWKGVLVRDILKETAIKPEANTIIFYAYDGYSTSFPLDYVMKNDIIMAYDLNGVELPPERGFPFQLVAEQKWGYKWIKWITKIELSSDTDYKGYWESRGYNNNGDLNGSKFENN